MLGIPEGWRLTFHHQIVRLLEVNDQPVRRAIRWAPAMPKLVRFFEDLIALKRREPDDRLITRLIEAEDAGDHLSRDELVAMIFLLLFAGHETSVNLIGNGLLALIDHPDQMALLRARPELMDRAVEELLRYTNPVEYGTMRFPTEDVTIAGVAIAKGDTVLALHASANRDEAAFADADKLDVTRDGGRHLAFGVGLHYCLGAALGRIETRVALDALLHRFPDMRLAIPRETVRWRQSSGAARRGVVAAPSRRRGRGILMRATAAAVVLTALCLWAAAPRALIAEEGSEGGSIGGTIEPPSAPAPKNMPTLKTTPPVRDTPKPQRYSFPVDTSPDGWAALKAAPDLGAPRLLKVYDGTLFTVFGHAGPWAHVRLASGETGWILGRLVGCCR